MDVGAASSTSFRAATVDPSIPIRGAVSSQEYIRHSLPISGAVVNSNLQIHLQINTSGQQTNEHTKRLRIRPSKSKRLADVSHQENKGLDCKTEGNTSCSLWAE